MPNYFKKFDVTIAKDASTSTNSANLKDFSQVCLELPATTNMDTASVKFQVFGCATSTGTFRPVAVQDTTAGELYLWTPRATGNFFLPLGEYGASCPQYLKVHSDTTATATAGYPCYIHVGA